MQNRDMDSAGRKDLTIWEGSDADTVCGIRFLGGGYG